MKILFLDISGTLDSWAWMSKANEEARGDDRVSREHVARVNRVTDATGAEIVITSDWVKHEPETSYPETRKMLIEHGMTGNIIGHTVQPFDAPLCDRVREIQAWLDAHPGVEEYALVDDIRMPLGPEARAWYSQPERAYPRTPDRLPPDYPGMAERFVHLNGTIGLTDNAAARLIKILGRSHGA